MVFFSGNTTTCRWFHSFLADKEVGRPDNHCPHLGKHEEDPDGKIKCTMDECKKGMRLLLKL